MSSLFVRTQFKNFITTNVPTEKFIDLSGQYDRIRDMLNDYGVGPTENWVGIDFIGSDESPITIGSSNTSGKYRESGAIYIHVVALAKLGVADSILTRAEALRNILRGIRIGTIFIESVTPVNFEQGAALRFDDGYISGSFIIGYENDIDL